jgi:hypothetical protein
MGFKKRRKPDNKHQKGLAEQIDDPETHGVRVCGRKGVCSCMGLDAGGGLQTTAPADRQHTHAPRANVLRLQTTPRAQKKRQRADDEDAEVTGSCVQRQAQAAVPCVPPLGLAPGGGQAGGCVAGRQSLGG